MLSITHAALSVATVCCVIGTADPFVLGVAAIASQFPDVDTTKSYTGLILYPSPAVKAVADYFTR